MSDDVTVPQGESVWLNVGGLSVEVRHGDDGVSVAVYPAGRETDGAIVETWAEFNEVEVEDAQ